MAPVYATHPEPIKNILGLSTHLSEIGYRGMEYRPPLSPQAKCKNVLTIASNPQGKSTVDSYKNAFVSKSDPILETELVVYIHQIVRNALSSSETDAELKEVLFEAYFAPLLIAIQNPEKFSEFYQDQNARFIDAKKTQIDWAFSLVKKIAARNQDAEPIFFSGEKQLIERFLLLNALGVNVMPDFFSRNKKDTRPLEERELTVADTCFFATRQRNENSSSFWGFLIRNRYTHIEQTNPDKAFPKNFFQQSALKLLPVLSDSTISEVYEILRKAFDYLADPDFQESASNKSNWKETRHRLVEEGIFSTNASLMKALWAILPDSFREMYLVRHRT